MIRASFGKRVARSTLIACLGLLAIPAVAGCEAGFNAPTLEFHSASAGANTELNGIQISNAFVLGAPSGSSVPAGSSASMFLGLYNNGLSDDKLVAITAPDAASHVTIKGGSVTIPATAPVDLSGPEPSVVLDGLTKPLTGGQSIPVTLDFAHAGSVTLDVPVEAQSYDYSTYSPPPATPTAAPSPTTTPAGKPHKSPAASPSPAKTK